MKVLILAIIISCVSCFASPSYNTVRPLTYTEKALVYEITKEANKSNKKEYYLKMLKILLTTPESTPDNIKNIMVDITEDGVIVARNETIKRAKNIGLTVDEYVNIEETYESKGHHSWQKYSPVLLGTYYYISIENVNDILVHLRVHLYGDEKQIKNIISVKDNIEKHISIVGFNFNLEFVGFSADDVFDIEVDPSGWPNSKNWSGGDYYVFSHELFHAMGLEDEYDLIESHARNEYISIKDRLLLFLYQMNKTLPPDANNGIMSIQTKRPLERHVCKAVGLGEECVKARTNK